MSRRNIITVWVLTAFLLLPAALRAADGNGQQLVLTLNNGNVSKFALTDNPVITYSGSDLIVTCGEAVLQTSMADITAVSFEEGSSAGIGVIDYRGGTPSFSFQTASFEGLPAGTRISVFTTDGKAVSTVTADGEGKARISMDSLPTGVYILRAPNKSYKFKK